MFDLKNKYLSNTVGCYILKMSRFYVYGGNLHNTMITINQHLIQFSRNFLVLIIKTAIILTISPLPVFSQEILDKEALFKKAQSYFFNKKFEMAEAYLLDVVQKDPENALAYSYLGDLFLLKKKYDAALTMYKRAIDIKPSIAENYFRIGQIYYYQKEGKLSIENFKKSVSLDNQIKIAFYHIGLSYLMLERDKENTITNWETFLRMVPEDPQYEKIRRVIELLRDPKFKLPPKGSKESIEEALFLGGITLENVERQTTDTKAGHEQKKSTKKIEDIYSDDDL